MSPRATFLGRACLTGAHLPTLLELAMAWDGVSLSELAQEIARASQGPVENLRPLLSSHS
ncbi:MAG: hypothetical protein PVI59_00980 [Anaerolineae bacterium]|jgi:hypothetical protein